MSRNAFGAVFVVCPVSSSFGSLVKCRLAMPHMQKCMQRALGDAMADGKASNAKESVCLQIWLPKLKGTSPQKQKV